MKTTATTAPVSDDFPSDEYDAIHGMLEPLHGGWSNYVEYASGWMGVAYRFSQMAEEDEAFRSAYQNNDRYGQEKALFAFFMAGISVVETLAYATHFIAERVRPKDFPTSEGALKRISPASVATALRTSFGDISVGKELLRISNSHQYRDWGQVRIVLFHRSSPGRNISVTVGAPRARESWNVPGRLEVNEELTKTRRAWLGDSVKILLSAEREFVESTLN